LRFLSLFLCLLFFREGESELRIGFRPHEQEVGAMVVVVLHGDRGLRNLLFSEFHVQHGVGAFVGSEFLGAAVRSLRVRHTLRGDGVTTAACCDGGSENACGDEETFHVEP